MNLEIAIPFVLFGIQVFLTFYFVQSNSKYRNTLNGQEQLRLDAFAIPSRIWKDVVEREVVLQDGDRLNEFRIAKGDNVKKSDFVLAQLQDHDSYSPSLRVIVSSINSYLYSNQGGQPDYLLIKDICDRSIETHENEMLEYIPAPLYVGLVGAMAGIIVSLFQLDLELLQDDFGAIEPMLDSIQWALGVSVIGLGLTTVFSVFLSKKSRAKVNEDKFRFLTFIQTELLPVMTQADMTGVQALSTNLNSFNRSAKEYVARLGDSIEQGTQIVEQETRIVESIKEMDVRAIANQNVHVLKELNEVMATFDKFKGFYSALTASLRDMDHISSSLSTFVQKSEYLESTFKMIAQTAEDNHGMYKYFQEHFNQIEDYKRMYGELVGSTSSSIKKHTEELVNFSQERSSEEKEKIAEIAKNLSGTLEDLAKKVESATRSSILEIEKAYSKSQPKFEHLEQLTKLDGIKNQLEKDVITERLDRMELALNKSIKQSGVDTKELGDVISHAIARGFTGSQGKQTQRPEEEEGKEKPKRRKKSWYDRLPLFGSRSKSN